MCRVFRYVVVIGYVGFRLSGVVVGSGCSGSVAVAALRCSVGLRSCGGVQGVPWVRGVQSVSYELIRYSSALAGFMGFKGFSACALEESGVRSGQGLWVRSSV